MGRVMKDSEYLAAPLTSKRDRYSFQLITAGRFLKLKC